MSDPEKKCREIIDRIGYCCSMAKDFPEEYEFFKEVLAFHESNKAKDMVDLQIVKSMYGGPQLQYINTDMTQDTISWVKCAKLMKSKMRSRIRG